MKTRPLVLATVLVAVAGCAPMGAGVAPVVTGPEEGLQQAQVSLPLGEPPAVESLPPDFYDDAASYSKALIENYLALSDTITAEGGRGPERMRELVTPAWFPLELQGFARYRSQEELTVGSTRLDGVILQLARRTPAGALDVGAVACIDTRGVLLLGEQDAPPPASVLAWLSNPEVYLADPSESDEIAEYFDALPPRLGDRRAIVFWLAGERWETLRIDHSEQWWGATQCR